MRRTSGRLNYEKKTVVFVFDLRVIKVFRGCACWNSVRAGPSEHVSPSIATRLFFFSFSPRPRRRRVLLCTNPRPLGPPSPSFVFYSKCSPHSFLPHSFSPPLSKARLQVSRSTRPRSFRYVLGCSSSECPPLSKMNDSWGDNGSLLILNISFHFAVRCRPCFLGAVCCAVQSCRSP